MPFHRMPHCGVQICIYFTTHSLFFCIRKVVVLLIISRFLYSDQPISMIFTSRRKVFTMQIWQGYTPIHLNLQLK